MRRLIRYCLSLMHSLSQHSIPTQGVFRRTNTPSGDVRIKGLRLYLSLVLETLLKAAQALSDRPSGIEMYPFLIPFDH
jgi:hypothetical protein